MQRICNSLAINGYNVKLIGRKLQNSIPLKAEKYEQKRISCWFNKTFLFYVEYNIRLFFYLLFAKTDIICAIDLDTILPCYFTSKLKNKKCVYDAHELFTEQKEIVTRPFVHKVWKVVEKFTVPKIKNGYTVNGFIQEELNKKYKVDYEIIRNLPKYYELFDINEQPTTPYFYYQGAVNEGRSFETLIPAMKNVNATLIICGKGNFFEQTEQLIFENNVSHKTELKGLVIPENLKVIARNAYAGITIFEATGLNQYQSLANRFFDYIMAGIPQICVNYPEYKKINDEYNIALMIDDTNETTIANAMTELLTNKTLYNTLKKNTLKAREELNWQSEEKKLLEFYSKLH